MSLYVQKHKKLSLFPGAKVADKYIVGKAGADALHVLPIAIITDEPMCIIEDSTERNGVTVTDIPLECAPLGGSSGTLWALAGGVVANDDQILVLADGTVVGSSAASDATYWCIGKAIGDTATGSGDGIEFQPCIPFQVVIS